MYSEGIAETETSSRIMGRDPFITGQLGYAFAVSGNSGKAREILKALLQRPDARGILSLAVANIYIGLGDKDRAFEWLQKCVDQQNQDIIAWISPLNFARKQVDFFSRRQAGTGQWFLEDSKFKTWQGGSGETLWCPGVRKISP